MFTNIIIKIEIKCVNVKFLLTKTKKGRVNLEEVGLKLSSFFDQKIYQALNLPFVHYYLHPI